MISYEKLHEILNYNPDTGIFIWKKKTGKKVIIGSVAGSTSKNGYTLIMINKKRYPAHRLAWMYVNGYDSENEIDHIDRNPSNNAIGNLREASRQCNCRNTGMLKNNSSGVKGVHWDNARKKWVSQIKVNMGLKFLGRFESIIEASRARWLGEVKYGFPRCKSDSSALLYIKNHAPEVYQELLGGPSKR